MEITCKNITSENEKKIPVIKMSLLFSSILSFFNFNLKSAGNPIKIPMIIKKYTNSFITYHTPKSEGISRLDLRL